MSHGHGASHGDGDNKKIAIFISLLALLLAVAETAGKSAQTNALSYNVEASNLWSFFQAKTIRKTTMETAAEHLEIDAQLASDPQAKQLLQTRIAGWKARAANYESEPKPNDLGEGRRELMARAKQAEEKRDLAMAKYHHYEVASAAFQIAIVLASAFVITGVVYLAWIAGGLGALGLIFMAIGFFAPHAVHLL